MVFSEVKQERLSKFNQQFQIFRATLEVNESPIPLKVLKAGHDLTLALADMNRYKADLPDTAINEGRIVFQIAIEKLPNNEVRRELIKNYAIYEYHSEILEKTDATILPDQKLVPLEMDLAAPVNLRELFVEFDIRTHLLEQVSGPVLDVAMQLKGYISLIKVCGINSIGSQNLSFFDYFNNGVRVYVPESLTVRNKKFEENLTPSTKLVMEQIQKKLAN